MEDPNLFAGHRSRTRNNDGTGPIGRSWRRPPFFVTYQNIFAIIRCGDRGGAIGQSDLGINSES